MESRIKEILSSTNKKQHLIDVLDRLLKESDFYAEILEKSQTLMESHGDDYKELCDQLGDYVYENMPEKTRVGFEREVCRFVDEEVHPRL